MQNKQISIIGIFFFDIIDKKTVRILTTSKVLKCHFYQCIKNRMFFHTLTKVQRHSTRLYLDRQIFSSKISIRIELALEHTLILSRAQK